MNQTFTIREKTYQIVLLLIPILITQLGMFSMVFFNTIMSGRYSAEALAGVAIGSSIWHPVFTGLSGILLAVSPLVAQSFGKKNSEDISNTVAHGVYLSLIISIIVFTIGYFVLDPILSFMNLDETVRITAKGYLTGLSIGIMPLFLFNTLRSFIYGLGKTRIVMVILLISLPINLVLNYCFIFGKGFFPELGGAGGGYATACTFWFIVIFTSIIIFKQDPFRQYINRASFKTFTWKKSGEILKIGVPMGLSIFFETGMFAVVTILISQYDVVTIASYQSALNVVSFVYMIPLSISMALTVLVGYEVGAKRNKDAHTYSWLGLALSLMIALVTGLLVILFRFEVAGLYSNEEAVIHFIAYFLIYALFFQISDALQATAQAALRGYKDVNIAFIITLISYWFICLPLGYVLANIVGLGATGYWIGLTIGLFIAGIALGMRLFYIQKKKFVTVESNHSY